MSLHRHSKPSRKKKKKLQSQHHSPWEHTSPSPEAWLHPLQQGNSLITKEQLRAKEHQYFADQVQDMVPFWIRGVQAAERGQVLRLEEFLDSLETESWPPRGPDVWAHPDRHSNYGGRPLNTWDTAWNNDVKKWADSVSAASAESGRTTPNKRSVTPQPCSPQSVRDPHSLVEVVARRNAVSENRKLEMYSFLELPTNEKVKRIDDLIRSLRSS